MITARRLSLLVTDVRIRGGAGRGGIRVDFDFLVPLLVPFGPLCLYAFISYLPKMPATTACVFICARLRLLMCFLYFYYY